jgi:hypothetical protein
MFWVSSFNVVVYDAPAATDCAPAMAMPSSSAVSPTTTVNSTGGDAGSATACAIPSAARHWAHTTALPDTVPMTCMSLADTTLEVGTRQAALLHRKSLP